MSRGVVFVPEHLILSQAGSYDVAVDLGKLIIRVIVK